MAYGLAIIEGLSMLPSYAPGERVVVKYNAQFAEGDVVLVDFETRVDIKRVKKVELDQVFIEGDNQAVSVDSRQYGSVKRDRVIAKVIYRLPNWLIRK
jgi:phage repressor protein C with HTH and peptisase S24 domain